MDRTYLIIFSISIALVGALGAIFMTRHSIFPLVGAPFTMKSFCLIAMAGIGNLMGILWCSLILGLAENFVLSFRGYAGWADILFSRPDCRRDHRPFPPEAGKMRNPGYLLYLLLLLLLLTLPFYTGVYFLNVMDIILIYMALALSWDMLLPLGADFLRVWRVFSE